MIPASAGVVLVCCAVLACAGGERGDDGTVVRDSAGVRIVEHAPPLETWTLGEAPELRIGVLDGDSTQLLHDVSHAARLRDGRVVVVDRGAFEVRVFGADGAYLRSFGRSGEGPGEFREIASAVLAPADTVVLYDRRVRRLTFASPDDGTMREAFPAALTSGDVRVLGRRPDGSTVVELMESHLDRGRGGYGTGRDTIALLAYGPGGAVDTIVRAPGNETLFWLAVGADGVPSYVVLMEPPFGARVEAALMGERVVVADAVRRQLELHDADRGLTLIRIAQGPPAAVDAALADRWVANAVERARSMGVDPVNAEQNARDQMETVPAGHVLPPFDRIVADDAGGAWLRDYVLPWDADGPRQWTVLDDGARPVARVTTPARTRITHIDGDRVTGVLRGELDEQYVVVYGVRRTQ